MSETAQRPRLMDAAVTLKVPHRADGWPEFEEDGPFDGVLDAEIELKAFRTVEQLLEAHIIDSLAHKIDRLKWGAGGKLGRHTFDGRNLGHVGQFWQSNRATLPQE